MMYRSRCTYYILYIIRFIIIHPKADITRVCVRWDWYFCLSAHTHTRGHADRPATRAFLVFLYWYIYVYIIYVYVYIVVVCVGGKRRVPGFFSAIIHRRASPCCSIALPAPIAVLKGKNITHYVFYNILSMSSSWCILLWYSSSRSKNKTVWRELAQYRL